jgi:RNA polymerase sigma-70 factor (ECF subfamily)
MMSSGHDPTEQTLLAALSLGDEAALRQIFDRYYNILLGNVYRIIPDEDTCQDLVQEVFVELWRKRSELDIHTSLQAYLRRAAVNRALNHIKSQRKVQLQEPDQWAVAADTSAADIRHLEKQETLEAALHRAIDLLPEKCRLVFSLSRFEQMSHKEIAEQLGISVKTIENQITKAMKMLREVLLHSRDLSPVVIWILNCWLGHRG